MNAMNQRTELLDAANAYIAQNREKLDTRYRPCFHAVAPIGWINDPNGFYFDGEWYHLFYQHYPYDAKWNDMHWGHWRSRDLVHWEDLPVVMAPDQPYDVSGCFSGTALPDGRGGAHILYTGVSEEGNLQQQCLAHFDGTDMVKAENNPVMPFELLPEGYVRKDFRDPKLIRTADGYRAVMAAKHSSGGLLVCFSSPDMNRWKYEGVYCRTEGIMPECPDVFPMDGKTVVLYSKVEKKGKNGENPRPVLYTVGETDREKIHFTPGAWQFVDHGREFYATQTCEGKNGERIAVSWMASWETEYPTALLDHGWSGMMSLPRVLRLEGDRIVQEPVPEIRKLRQEKNRLCAEIDNARVCLEDVCARHAEIHFRADVSQAGAVVLSVMEDHDEKVSLLWLEDTLILNRTDIAYNQMGRFIPEIRMPLRAVEGQLEMTVFVDNCSVEVFAGGETMSAIAFPKGEAYNLSVSVKGRAEVELDCWKLG